VIDPLHGPPEARVLAATPELRRARAGTRAIATGDLLRVDGDTGQVTVLERRLASAV
jgi:hypothetical protein